MRHALTLKEVRTYTGGMDPAKLPLQAKGHDASASVPAGAPSGEESDPFFYGARWVPVDRGDGTTDLEQVPLTEEDLLDPQDGDEMPQGSLHSEIVLSLRQRLKDWFKKREPQTAVYHDMKVRWPAEREFSPAPDLCVVRGLPDLQANRDSFDVLREGVAPCLVIEVTSPSTRRTDLGKKVDSYARVGVEEYFIVDTAPWRSGTGPLSLMGHRLREGSYCRIEPNEQGRLRSRTAGLLLSVRPDAPEVVLENAGQEILSESAERALAEAAARQTAERRAQLEEAGRREAEQRTQEAEQRAQAEAAKRRKAEERLRELEQKLKRLGIPSD